MLRGTFENPVRRKLRSRTQMLRNAALENPNVAKTLRAAAV
jgi:hypothetical protein